LRRNIAAGRCRSDQLAQSLEDGRRQHLVQILDREPAQARERRSDAVDRRVERLASDDVRQQLKDVFEMARLILGEFLYARRLRLRSIEQMVAAPSLRRYGQLPFDHRDDFRAVEGYSRTLRQDSIDGAAAVIPHLEARIAKPVDQAADAALCGDGSEYPRQTTAQDEIRFRIEQRVDQHAEV